MRKNVIISVSSEITYAQDMKESISQRARGVCDLHGSLLRISYVNEEGEECCKTEIIINTADTSRVRVRRTGDISSDMVFSEGVVHEFDYRAGALFLTASIFTHSMTVINSKNETVVCIDYTLTISGGEQRSRIQYTVREDKNASK